MTCRNRSERSKWPTDRCWGQTPPSWPKKIYWRMRMWLIAQKTVMWRSSVRWPFAVRVAGLHNPGLPRAAPLAARLCPPPPAPWWTPSSSSVSPPRPTAALLPLSDSLYSLLQSHQPGRMWFVPTRGAGPGLHGLLLLLRKWQPAGSSPLHTYK